MIIKYFIINNKDNFLHLFSKIITSTIIDKVFLRRSEEAFEVLKIETTRI
ncbi:hypothetical protein IQ05_00841 [Flavobacterium tiangeerense]|uniref:Uncharacterized protein n=1 Tax=Flavobacterium tiangeerense TaxID=459471 RepID=A0ABY3FLB1_9FLAO|nr:hypothetical protein IQ05_00841 [Flavobacterium tiangeerense]